MVSCLSGPVCRVLLGKPALGSAVPKPIPDSPVESAAWSGAELANPHGHAEKALKVRRMFAAIAGSYDLNNRVHSLWRDQAWRRYAVKRAEVQPGDTVVDVACGTGDLSEAFARTAAGRVIGIDFTPQMLEVAERKRAKLGAEAAAKLSYQEGDAQALALPDASADVVSIAFGIRNVAEPARAVREFARILRPGGRLVILEFDRPGFAPARWLNDLYCGWLMPRTATMISGDRSGAYRYLPKSVGSFMPRGELCELMRGSGLTRVEAKLLTMGICVCYRSEKPA
jgi:demethylmenaquinone methyltransferase/2-methoxy-6-polyprenyl-1,4-benzoquinol methylase